MIGVISRPDELATVEEFFQLFKTPWEMFRPGNSYDVLLITTDEIPQAHARLVLLFGSETKDSDDQMKVRPSSRLRHASLSCEGTLLPLYGDALTFTKEAQQVVCTSANGAIIGLAIDAASPKTIRLGYDLFQEIQFLLTAGQPVEHAHAPTLELHIALLRSLILQAGIPVVEIPPCPAGYDFAVCLTHDIDFVGIRYHKFDHTMWGFLYRSTMGAMANFLRRKLSLARLVEGWRAALSLPLVYLGWVKDFWQPFDWYLQAERNLSPTYFFIPFKFRPGTKVPAAHADRRACAYDIIDIPQWTARLQEAGCEIGVHGIDAWHSVELGREEFERVEGATGLHELGIRMHWLLRDEKTYGVLEEAGYAYDATTGYNETIGYRCGTTQSFRPLTAKKLLELPLHVQDGALFFPHRLGLTESAAWIQCHALIENARKLGGVLSVLWHDRSHGPERFWGDFYLRLIQRLESLEAWFGSALEVVSWFRNRRAVAFQRAQDNHVKLCGIGRRVMPGFKIRVYSPQPAPGQSSSLWEHKRTDFEWAGDRNLEIEVSPKTEIPTLKVPNSKTLHAPLMPRTSFSDQAWLARTS